jgi:hypothetical protein
VLVLALVLAAATAGAHSPDPAAGALEPRLDALAPGLAELRVQLRRSLGPQLVLENPGERTLEVLDVRGVAFLRIGPDGVFGNLASPAWYHSLAPEAAGVPPELAKLLREGVAVPDRWVRVAKEPSWGWFDTRLDPEQAGGGGAHAKPETWSVPVRLGDTKGALRGRFVPSPQPTGRLQPRMRSDAELAPGVRVTLVPGLGGSLLLTSRSPEPVTVLGHDGAPFLRFGPDGVEANLRSATFAHSARLRGGAELAMQAAADGGPHWQRLSSVPSHAWIDPRTTPDAAREAPQRWRVPVRIGLGDDAALVHIEGETTWEAFGEEAKGHPAGDAR